MNAQHDIQQNTIWDGNDPNHPPPSTISGDITIFGNYYLIIRNCTIAMPSTSKILVKRNAKLYIDNVIIEAISGQWEGIRCDNGSATIQASDRIPYVKIDESKITYADLAFANYYDNGTNTNYGGAIEATDVVFEECYNYLDIQECEYNQKQLELCHFYRCKFLETSQCGTDGHYIYMENVKNVYFKGCLFDNICGGANTIAIEAVESKFSINKYAGTGSVVKNEFINFSYGVRVTNHPCSTKTPVIVADCIFKIRDIYSTLYNREPIYLKSCLNAHIYSNEFIITADYNDKIAIKLNECKEFIVEDNEIIFNGQNKDRTGILIFNSGIKTNQVYNNYIENATYGIYADGTNRGLDDFDEPDQGLKFLCNIFNNFDNTSYYFYVTNCNNSNPLFGVSRWQ